MVLAGIHLLSPSGKRTFFLVLSFVIAAHFSVGYFGHEYHRPIKRFIDFGQAPLQAANPEKIHHAAAADVTLKSLSEPLPTRLIFDESVSPAYDDHVLQRPAEPTLANATFFMLCRNDELDGVVSSVRQVEDRFNRKHGYPWVFLNDEPFTDEFKERVAVLTDSPMHFGLIPPEQWHQPDWIDDEKALASRTRMVSQGIIYGGSVSYRNMCRFNSGFFFHHELMKPYRWYWRVEPNVKYFCDLNYDPFKFMEDNNKVYGFTISIVELPETIPSLWEATKEFLYKNYHFLNPNNALRFLSENGGDAYNLCHFWSNFEIADMNFWRGEAYTKYFEYLESKGGFYYERWGDAPVHSMAVSLFASKDQIHFFNDIGYKHEYFQHCPTGQAWYDGHCGCNPRDTFDDNPSSCTAKFLGLFANNTIVP